MAIKKCCENCALEKTKNNQYCFKCLNDEFENLNADFFNRFIPKEELIRADEREKIITDLEYEIQNFNEVRDSKTIDFINDFIRELRGKNENK